MINGFKINKYWSLTFCMLFFSINSVFSQELPDAEIGLNVIELTASLKERGLSDDAINQEIIFTRQQLTERYLEIKKMQGLGPLLQKTVEVQENQTSSSINSNSEISDQEIGFDATRETILLKDRGITNPEEINRELDRVREMTKMQYSRMKEAEQEFLQSIQSRRLLKATMTGDVSQSEKEALKALFDSTNGRNWTNKTGWDFSTPVTTWNGITGWYGVVVTNGHISTINLSSNNLQGTLPNLSALTNLQHLVLMNNTFTGTTIPSTLNSLTNINYIYLDNCNFTGTIPDLSSLKKLSVFSIGNNSSLSPYEIPEWILNCTTLELLNLHDTNLIGIIPQEIKNLSQLVSLDLATNKLIGIIPSQIGSLVNLTDLSLGYNELEGNIPSEIGNLSKLQFLYLSGNRLSGKIPTGINKLTNIIGIWLHQNLNLEGTIPDLTKLSSLNNLYLYGNKFRFKDFADQFSLYKTKINNGFEYSPQTSTDTSKTIALSIGESTILTMCEDGNFHAKDTYQWFKNGNLIEGAVNRTYTITDFKITDAGTYICKSSHSKDPDMSPLILEREPIILNLVNCAAIAGTIKSPLEKFYTNLDNTFIFETTLTNLSFVWSVARAAGDIVSITEPKKNGLYAYKFPTEGDYIITLIVTDDAGCSTTFTKNITAAAKYCVGEAAKFAFESTAANLTYTWTAANSENVVVDSITNTSGQYTFTPQIAGEYVIKLNTNGTQNCETVFSKNISVENCLPDASCTKTNVNTPEIHRLFITLINKLAGTPSGSDVNTYARKEIAALSPYTTTLEPKIYNFVNTSTEVSFSFSEAAAGYDVQIPKSLSKSITNIDLSNYENALSKITVATKFSDATIDSNGYVRNINFCVNELSCVSHVALVVDESGSISPTEFNKIKKQLKAFVLQQATTNDNTGSNIYVSLTGMSDSDENLRTDFINPTKLTNTPTSLYQFNSWIDALGTRNGKTTGISASSDYWRSGLEGALGYSMKPNMVIMITDGCQTADVLGLKTTLKKFNNAPGSNPELPHLYVVGIENGFYVDENHYINSSANQDPNSNQNLVNTVTTHLVKSLKYLFEFPEKQFPTSDINQFNLGTFYGHTDFSLLASDDTYFSDKLINANIICGTPSIKDFCDDCLSFKPEPGKEYVLSAWVKEDLFAQVKTYENTAIKIVFYNNKEALDIRAHKIDSLSIKASGNIIDGWQRVVKKFKIPENTITIGVQLENNSPSIPVYFDDIRIYPVQGSVKSFVYDPETFKLMSELDENNYGTFYEYDNEGGLVRVKKETEKGIKTIQERRSGSVINTKD